MDELEIVLADTSNEELTAEKKIQYINVSCRFLHFTVMLINYIHIAPQLYRHRHRGTCIYSAFFGTDKFSLLHLAFCICIFDLSYFERLIFGF